MEKILVTGGSGFIGRYVVDYFKPRYAITSLGNSTKDDIIADLAAGIPYLPPGGFDVLIHLAGKAHSVARTAGEAKAFHEVNLQGLKNLLMGFERGNHKPKRFVLFSTVAVYGLESGELIPETTPCLATDPYGQSKAMAEIEAIEWSRQHGVALTILRLPLVVGKNAPGNLGAMITAIKRKRYFEIGNGTTRRSMVHAADICPFIEKVWDKGGTFHLTDGCNPSFRELSVAIAKELGKRPSPRVPLLIALVAAVIFDALAKLTGKQMPFSKRKLSKMSNSCTFDDSAGRSAGWEGSSVISRAGDWAI